MENFGFQNFVATCNFGVDIDLKKFALSAKNVEYSPRRFAAAIVKIRTPDSTGLIFRTGKCVVAGAKTEEIARRNARRLGRIVQKIFGSASILNFKIQNIVGSFNVGFKIRLSTVCALSPSFIVYEPELFPGIRWVLHNYIDSPNLVVLLFHSGKGVITGGRTCEDVYNAYINITQLLKSAQNLIRIV